MDDLSSSDRPNIAVTLLLFAVFWRWTVHFSWYKQVNNITPSLPSNKVFVWRKYEQVIGCPERTAPPSDDSSALSWPSAHCASPPLRPRRSPRRWCDRPPAQSSADEPRPAPSDHKQKFPSAPEDRNMRPLHKHIVLARTHNSFVVLFPSSRLQVEAVFIF